MRRISEWDCDPGAVAVQLMEAIGRDVAAAVAAGMPHDEAAARLASAAYLLGFQMRAKDVNGDAKTVFHHSERLMIVGMVDAAPKEREK